MFMGGEFGVWHEWYCKEALDWSLLEYSMHKGMQIMVKELNHLYLKTPCFWEKDFDYTGFEWLTFEDRENCVIAYRRKGWDSEVICVHNFTPAYHEGYFVGVSNVKAMREIFNSDSENYGGSNKLNKYVDILPYGFKISIAPLATMIFEVKYV